MSRSVLAACAFVLISSAVLSAQPAEPATGTGAAAWRANAAADYLDSRQLWWQSWPRAQKDHGTTCVSCHTVLSYAIGRPALRAALHETGPSAAEKTMLSFVEKRVSLWNETEPFYKEDRGPEKPAESRGTESVFNALILARYDSAAGAGMREITRKAFDNAWALQLKSGDSAGGWNWINFKNGPWESNDSPYWGAALGAIASGWTPANYRSEPAARSALDALRGYLRRGYAAQPLVNQIAALWADGAIGGVLEDAQKSALAAALSAKQKADGGWAIAELGPWQRQDKSEPETAHADGYATAIAVLALRNVPSAQAQVTRGKAWLTTSQKTQNGAWPSWSVNKQRDPDSDVGRFMSDAATAYAVLALER